MHTHRRKQTHAPCSHTHVTHMHAACSQAHTQTRIRVCKNARHYHKNSYLRQSFSAKILSRRLLIMASSVSSASCFSRARFILSKNCPEIYERNLLESGIYWSRQNLLYAGRRTDFRDQKSSDFSGEIFRE